MFQIQLGNMEAKSWRLVFKLKSYDPRNNAGKRISGILINSTLTMETEASFTQCEKVTCGKVSSGEEGQKGIRTLQCITISVSAGIPGIHQLPSFFPCFSVSDCPHSRFSGFSYQCITLISVSLCAATRIITYYCFKNQLIFKILDLYLGIIPLKDVMWCANSSFPNI